jgi:alkylated DNA repair dioxygenase AlkB
MDADSVEAVPLVRGAVLLRGAFSANELDRAFAAAWRRGERRTPQGAVQSGWYVSATSTLLNYGQWSGTGLGKVPTRGRVYDAIESYAFGMNEHDGWALQRLGTRALALAQRADTAMPDGAATHLLLVRYDGTKGIAGHVDDALVDGDDDAPIVSINLGNKAVFKYAEQPWNRFLGVDQGTHGVGAVEMQHGDALVWGGPARYLWHEVVGVQPGTAPASICQLSGRPSGTRLNLTFRATPRLRGREGEFQQVEKNESSEQKRAAKEQRAANDAKWAGRASA